jgi:hypothetical protein
MGSDWLKDVNERCSKIRSASCTTRRGGGGILVNYAEHISTVSISLGIETKQQGALPEEIPACMSSYI